MKTKNLRKVLTAGFVLALCSAVIFSCKKKVETPAMNISAITANGVDLNGQSSATGVDPNATITITFTDDVAPTSATNANIKLTNTDNNTNVPLSITASGATVTAKPDTALASGTGYALDIANVTSVENVAVTATTRHFTTAGTYAPSGAVA